MKSECVDVTILSAAKEYSELKVASIRKKLEEALGSIGKDHEICVVTTGSFARNEASTESDIDLFLITKDPDSKVTSKMILELESVINSEISKDPGSTGTFGVDVVLTIDDIINNIGGTNDDNHSLTRRMLLLLEGTYLYNQESFELYRNMLIETYIKEGISKHQISRFFLNDIIRYYRTIATDFEYKVSEDNKPWGLRNIKLLFSRKLLYFSGILIVAETYNKSREDKVKTTKDQVQRSPLDRILYLSNGINTDTIISTYSEFLESLSKKEIRNTLTSVERDDRNDNEEFVRLKEIGRDFSLALSEFLNNKYEKDHPIHHSLLF